MVGKITINDLVGKYDIRICSILWARDSVTSVQFCDFVILWHQSWYTVMIHCDRNICMFWRIVNLDVWFLQPWPWPPSNLRACEFGCCSWESTTWNPGFMLFETKLGIDTSRCLKHRLQVLNKVGWFLIDNVKLLESVFGKQKSWLLCWPNEFELTIQNSLNGSVNWSLAV